MAVLFSPIGNGFQFFTTTGLPLNGGFLYTYLAGTTTPTATYTDNTGGTPNSNPIVLSSDGRLANEVWLTQGLAYKFTLKDSLNNTIATYDNIPGINDKTISADIDMNGFKITDMGAGILASDATNLGQVQSGASQTLSSVSGTNTITATASPIPTLIIGSRFYFIPAVTNTGPTTINIGGIGAKNIFFNTIALTGGELQSSTMAEIVYDGTQFQLIAASKNTQTQGTWTPALFGGTTTTYNARNGSYIKIGKLVFFQGSLEMLSVGDASTGASITGSGLPTPATPSGLNNGLATLRIQNCATSIVSATGIIASSATFQISIFARTAASVSDSGVAIWGGTTIANFSGCYIAA